MNDHLTNPESPFYDGPELKGLSPDARFDLAKQLRIAARNRRLSAVQRKQDAQNEREKAAIWFGICYAVVALGITGLVLWHGL